METDNEFIWTRRSVLFFLDRVEKRKDDLRNPKIQKKTVWKEITREMVAEGYHNVKALTVERKFRNMKATYRTIKERKRTSSGTGHIKWEYFDIMDSILQEDETDTTLPLETFYITVDNDEELSTSSASSSASFPKLKHETITPAETRESPKLTFRTRQKADRAKQLYGLRKKQLEIEEDRINELRLLRESVEKNNQIQQERNDLLKLYLKQNMPSVKFSK